MKNRKRKIKTKQGRKMSKQEAREYVFKQFAGTLKMLAKN